MLILNRHIFFKQNKILYKNNFFVHLKKNQNQKIFFYQKRNYSRKNDTNMSTSSVGCFIDIDGVVWSGGMPFDNAKKALNLLTKHKIPYVFVTNGTHSPSVLRDKINGALDINVTNDHIIAAQTPCASLKQYHNKHVLLCCQDDGIEAARECGFNNFITIPELTEIFPDLDYVDHEKRKVKYNEEEIAKRQKDFKPIEAVLCLGEPVNWEGALQVVIDILMTNGDPRVDPTSPDKFSTIPHSHLPVIACNKDLTFKGAAQLPRFGHGAFLECLEHLYERITNHELRYEVLIGKPYMSTYKFATSALEKINSNKPIKKVFIIGDNPDVDIKGANLFNFYTKTNTKKKDKRQIDVESILVCTGVYNPTRKLNDELEHLEIDKLLKLSVELDEKSLKNLFSHKRSTHDNMLSKPNVILNDILDAVHHIVKSL